MEANQLIRLSIAASIVAISVGCHSAGSPPTGPRLQQWNTVHVGGTDGVVMQEGHVRPIGCNGVQWSGQCNSLVDWHVPNTDGFLCGWTITEDYENGSCAVTVNNDYRSLRMSCDAAPAGFWGGGGHAAIFIESVNVVKTLAEAKTCVKNTNTLTGELRLLPVGCDHNGDQTWAMCGWFIGNTPVNSPPIPCPSGMKQCPAT